MILVTMRSYTLDVAKWLNKEATVVGCDLLARDCLIHLPIGHVNILGSLLYI